MMDTRKLILFLLLLSMMVNGASAADIYYENFSSFNLAALNGQDSWVGNNAEISVQNTIVRSNYAVQMVDSSSTQRIAEKIYGTSANTKGNFTAWVRSDVNSSNNYMMVRLMEGTSSKTGLSFVNGTWGYGLTRVSSGTAFQPDTWYQIKIAWDGTTDKISYYYRLSTSADWSVIYENQSVSHTYLSKAYIETQSTATNNYWFDDIYVYNGTYVEHSESTPATDTTVHVSTTGNNSNAGTYTAPYKTITWAAAHVSPGWNVSVEPGTYTESVVLGTSGTLGTPVRIFANGSVYLHNDTATTGIYLTNKNYITIDGFDIDGYDYGIYSNIDTSTTSRGIQILNNTINDSSINIWIRGVSSTTSNASRYIISGNTLLNATSSTTTGALRATMMHDHSIISNNEITDAIVCPGINIGGSSDIVISENNIHDLNHNAITFEPSTTGHSDTVSHNITVENNIISDVTGRGVRFDYNCTDYHVIGNIITNTGDAAFNAYPYTTGEFSDNVIEGGYGLRVSYVDSCLMNNNTWSNTTNYFEINGQSSPLEYAKNVTFTNNTLYNTSHGLDLSFVRDSIISRNTFENQNTTWAAIFSKSSGAGALDNVSILNNIFINQPHDAIELNRATSGVLQDVTIRNNIFYNVDGYTIYKASDATITNFVISNNCMWLAPLGYYGTSSSNDVLANPLFVSSTDYHLQKYSPCLAAGFNNVDIGRYQTNHTSIVSFTPTDTTPSALNGSTTQFTATLSSSGFWEALVNGTVLTNGTSTSAAYNYTASSIGDKNITIRTDDDQQTWTLTVEELSDGIHLGFWQYWTGTGWGFVNATPTDNSAWIRDLKVTVS